MAAMVSVVDAAAVDGEAEGLEGRGLEYGGIPWDAATGHGQRGP